MALAALAKSEIIFLKRRTVAILHTTIPQICIIHKICYTTITIHRPADIKLNILIKQRESKRINSQLCIDVTIMSKYTYLQESILQDRLIKDQSAALCAINNNKYHD